MRETKMSRRYRAYVLGFRQEWANANQNLCKRLIAESDFCIARAEGIAIGEDVSTYTIKAGKVGSIGIPRNIKCIGHEYEGKVVIIESA